DAGVEEAFQGAVAHRLAAHLADPLQPPGIAQEDEEHRRNADPGHRRKKRTDRCPLRRVRDAQDGRLLEVRLCRGAEGGGDQQIEKTLVWKDVAVTPDRLACQHTSYELIVAAVPRGTAVAEPSFDRVCVDRHYQLPPRP